MRTESETNRKKVELLLGLGRKKREKNLFFGLTAEKYENESRKLGKERDQILKNTFSEMTRWKVSRLSSRSHTANDSPVPRSQSLSLTGPVAVNIRTLDNEGNTTIHEAFANFISKKQKIFSIGSSTVVIKKKGRFYKRGIGELASQIAQVKPLEQKENLENNRIQEKRLRLRQAKRQNNLQNEKAQTVWQMFIPRRVSLSQQKAHKTPAVERAPKTPEWINRLNPWREDDQAIPSVLWHPNTSEFSLCDIFE